MPSAKKFYRKSLAETDYDYFGSCPRHSAALFLNTFFSFSARLLLDESAGPAPADPLVCGLMPLGLLAIYLIAILSYSRSCLDLLQLESDLVLLVLGIVHHIRIHTDRHDPICDHLPEKPSPILPKGM